MNTAVQRATATIAQEEVNTLLRNNPRHDGKPWAPEARKELTDRIHRAIEQAVEQEIEHIEGQLQ